ncbi:MAG: protein kinase [Candidatus Krumholzibacteriia bacterium]
MIGQTISRYRIEAQLGQGGMGVVYRARDLRLERSVALKFLAPELTRDPLARSRFLNEARAAAALNHPNIVTIYEVDEVAGQAFIAMELVAGTDLRQRLAGGPLPPSEATAITRQIAQGLARAHAAGIVHRDVKPANILLTPEGEAKIADFGLARLAGQARVTRTGTVLGTVAYMSPEQARGEEATPQTDIWALGVLHYEMLTGRLPFPGDSPQAQLYGILNTEPRSLTDLDPSLPPDQAVAVRSSLAKDPARRWASALDLAAALEGGVSGPLPPPLAVHDAPTEVLEPGAGRAWPAWFWPGRAWPGWARRGRRRRSAVVWPSVAILLLLAGLAAAWLVTRGGAVGSFAARDWLLVTEFRDLTGGDNLGAALREALVVDLQQSRHVNVFAGRRLSDALARMERSAGEPLTPDLGLELAEREGIPVVLSGSIGAVGDARVVAAQLIDPATGEVLFAQRVEAAGERDLLPAIDDLSRRIRRELGESLLAIRRHDQPLEQVTTPSLEALRLYSRAQRAFLASDWQEAVPLLAQAVARDSAFAMAHAKLARIHLYTASTHDALEHSERAYRWRERLTGRERLYIEGEYHRYRAQYPEAIARLTALLDQYPDDLESRTNLATTYMWTLQYDRALAQIDLLPEIDPYAPETWYFHHTRGNALGGLGEFEEAATAFRRAMEFTPGRSRSRMCLSWCLFGAGDVVAARAQLDTLAASGAEGVVGVDYMLGKTLPALGELERARQHLTAARATALAQGNDDQAAWTHMYEGSTRLLEQDLAAAERAFAAAAELWPGRYPLLYLGLARARRGDPAGAARARDRLAALAEVEPTEVNRQFLLKLEGEMALASGDPQRAVDLLARCPSTYVFNLDARFSLGVAALQLGDLETARREFAHVARHRYSTLLEGQGFLWPLAERHLARVAELDRRPEAAAAHRDTFFALWAGADPGLTEVAEARGRGEPGQAGR